MKSYYVLLAVLAAPSLVSAQNQSAPIVLAKAPQKPLPNALELIDNLYAPYAAAKTFSGNFDVLLLGKDQQHPIAEYHLKTAFRYDDKGDLEGQNTTMNVVGRAEPKPRQTFRFIDDGRANTVVFVDQKAWALKVPRDTSPALTAILKATLDSATLALHHSPGFVPVVSRGVDAGRPVWILKAKGSNAFRAVVDVQTRALRSFEILGEDQSVSIRGSEQEFDQPIADQVFTWTPPADFKQVAADDVHLPPSLGISVDTAQPQ